MIHNKITDNAFTEKHREGYLADDMHRNEDVKTKSNNTKENENLRVFSAKREVRVQEEINKEKKQKKNTKNKNKHNKFKHNQSGPHWTGIKER